MQQLLMMIHGALSPLLELGNDKYAPWNFLNDQTTL